MNTGKPDGSVSSGSNTPEKGDNFYGTEGRREYVSPMRISDARGVIGEFNVNPEGLAKNGHKEIPYDLRIGDQGDFSTRHRRHFNTYHEYQITKNECKMRIGTGYVGNASAVNLRVILYLPDLDSPFDSVGFQTIGTDQTKHDPIKETINIGSQGGITYYDTLKPRLRIK